MYKVFYCRYDIDFSQEEAAPLESSKIPALADKVLQEDDDFFGMVDHQEVTLQFMVEERQIWAEVPDPKRGGSFGQHMTREAALALISSLNGPLGEACLPEGVFVEW